MALQSYLAAYDRPAPKSFGLLWRSVLRSQPEATYIGFYASGLLKLNDTFGPDFEDKNTDIQWCNTTVRDLFHRHRTEAIAQPASMLIDTVRVIFERRANLAAAVETRLVPAAHREFLEVCDFAPEPNYRPESWGVFEVTDLNTDIFDLQMAVVRLFELLKTAAATRGSHSAGLVVPPSVPPPRSTPPPADYSPPPSVLPPTPEPFRHHRNPPVRAHSRSPSPRSRSWGWTPHWSWPQSQPRGVVDTDHRARRYGRDFDDNIPGYPGSWLADYRQYG